MDQPAVQLSLHCDSKRCKTKRGRGFPCGLRDRVGVRNGHLVGGRRLGVRLVLAGGAARRGSTGWRWRGGDGGGGAGGGADHAAAVGAAQSGRGLFFGLLAGELGDAEDELEAAQFDVAAVVEQSGALPARPATADQAGAARLTSARRLRAAAVRLARHHAAGEQEHGLGARSAVVFTLLTAAWKVRGDASC